MERISCQEGTTPNGMRASITMGEVHGMMDAQTDRGLLGCSKVWSMMNRPMISGMVTGSCSWLVSASLSTAAPMAANIEA